MSLTKLDTEDGHCFINVSAVVLIGPVVTTKAPARRIGFGSNVYQFVLNTPTNLHALGLHAEAIELDIAIEKARLQAKPTRTKRPRKATRTSAVEK